MNVVFENIPGFLIWLGSGPGIIAILSFLAERAAWFQNLTPKQKQGLSWGVAFILPQITLALLDVVPADIWTQLEPRFQAILTSVSVIATLLFSEVAHKVDQKVFSKKGSE